MCAEGEVLDGAAIAGSDAAETEANIALMPESSAFE
jgi:hypothetical protein